MEPRVGGRQKNQSLKGRASSAAALQPSLSVLEKESGLNYGGETYKGRRN